MAIGKPILEKSSQGQKRLTTQILTLSDPKIRGQDPKTLSKRAHNPLLEEAGLTKPTAAHPSGGPALAGSQSLSYQGKAQIEFVGEPWTRFKTVPAGDLGQEAGHSDRKRDRDRKRDQKRDRSDRKRDRGQEAGQVR